MTRPDKDDLDQLVRLANSESTEGKDASESLTPKATEELAQARAAMAFLENVKKDIANHPGDAGGQSQISTVANFLGENTPTNFEPYSTEDLQSFGRFEIIDSIGQGGFAKVFRARDPRLNREVALKIPKPDAIASAESQLRFQREAQSAAILSHPAIVPVFETGMIGPIGYIASELCDGENLSEWFADCKKSVETDTAVRIVAQLADAVHHAHQRGIIHRDLKPSNILVESGTEHISERIRITDFGLAKQIDSNDATLTLDGAIVGTPAYMSPEQAKGTDQAAIPMDIFSLGVIFYELLTGKRAFKRKSHLATLKAIENEAPIPLRKLAPTIPKDVEAICLKCLNKDPADRYKDSYSLAADLNAWRNGHAIKARHANWFEQFVRWSRRNPALSAVGALALVSFSLGLAGTTWQWQQAQKNLLNSKSEFKRAEENLKLTNQAVISEQAQRERAEKTLRYFGNIFSAPGPGQDGREVKAVQLLEDSKEEIPLLFADDPESRRVLMQQIGNAYLNLGLIKEANEILAPLHKTQVKSSAPATRDSIELARRIAEILSLQGDQTQALATVDEALLDAHETLGEHTVTIRCLKVRASILRYLGKHKEGIEELNTALTMNENLKQNGLPEEELVIAKSLMGAMLIGDRQVKKALPLLQETLDNQTLGKDSVAILSIRSEIVNALSALGRGAEPETVELIEEITDSKQKLYGEDHPVAVQALGNLAAVYTIANRKEEAIEMYELCYAKAKVAFGENSPMSAIPLGDCGTVFFRMNNFEEAKPRYLKAYPIMRKTLGIGNHRTARYMSYLAKIYELEGEWKKASDLWILLSEDFGAVKSKANESLMTAARSGSALIHQGKIDEGLKLIEPFLESIPGSSANEKGKITAERVFTIRTVGALLSQSDFDKSQSYMERLTDCLNQPDVPPNHMFVGSIFELAIAANLSDDKNAATLFLKIFPKDSDLSLDTVADPMERIWIQIALDEFLKSAAKEDSDLNRFVPAITSYLKPQQ